MTRIPKYRKQGGRNKGFVEIDGERIYLAGGYGSPESRREYDRVIAEYVARRATGRKRPKSPTVGLLCRDYLVWAQQYYAEGGEFDHLRYAAAPLLAIHERTGVAEFGPLALKEVRETMISGEWVAGGPRPWVRSHVNHQIGRIRRIFRWGVEHELVAPSVLAALESVAPLKAGRCAAAESQAVRPVDFADVEAMTGSTSPQIAAMVQLQWLTGMRSSNLCEMRPADIDRQADVWRYVPESHKSAWRGRRLCIFLGPRAQELLLPFLPRAAGDFLFSPREAIAWWADQRRANRETPIRPGQSKRKRRAKRAPRDKYDAHSYRRAIRYACKKAGVDPWHPHRLRHACATRVRSEEGIEAAQVYLGHAHASVTEIYAQRDLDLAARIAKRLG